MAQDTSTTIASPEIKVVAHEFQTLLQARGLHEALRFLNARTRHRFTGVYRIVPPVLHNVCLFDRENPAIHVGSETPLDETYCAITGELRKPFHFANSAEDDRFRGNPRRSTVVSYCGVPLRNDDGSAWGTLCHFDLRPRIVPVGEIPVLEVVAPLVLQIAQEGAPREGQLRLA